MKMLLKLAVVSAFAALSYAGCEPESDAGDNDASDSDGHWVLRDKNDE